MSGGSLRDGFLVEGGAERLKVVCGCGRMLFCYLLPLDGAHLFKQRLELLRSYLISRTHRGEFGFLRGL